MLETIAVGKSTTEFMKYGDWVSIEMRDPQGQSILEKSSNRWNHIFAEYIKNRAVNMLKLYSYYRSSAAFRVRIALELKGTS